MDISIVILENYLKNEKFTPLTVKKTNKIVRVNPNITFVSGKLTGSLKTQFYIRKK